MEKHRIALGALFLGLGLMGLLGIASVLFIFFVGSAVLGTAAANQSDFPAILTVLPMTFGLFISFAIAIGTVPSLVAGYGLLQGRSWARVWSLIAGVLNLPNIPLGTGVGIYAIWAFVQDESARHGSHPPPGS